LRAPKSGAALDSCTLRRILVYQGPDAVRQVLESFGPPGKNLRQHAETCTACADLVRELYGDRDIPVSKNYLTPELLKLLREPGG
jgi:hypothetical protein